ncbi:MAG: SDR family oxidoreductase [Marinibacterium sp.]|nr:SDR family oxidoreductase [Marinibacterium sp.]
MTKTLLSFGHGFSARSFAPLALAQGWTVIGTTRSTDKAETICKTGVQPLIWPGGSDPVDLDGVTHILVSAGPDENGDPVLRDLGAEIADRTGQFEWVGYLSTTGVYGNHDGAWVDETTELHPTSRRAIWRTEAEDAWRAITGLPVHVFRLAGIYGPGRGPFEKLRNGTARRVIKPGQVFSRIHVEDIAQVLMASINRPNPGAIYNLCDDDPAPPQDVIAYAAELLGLPVPPPIPFDQAEMTPMARSFYADSKRVRNDRIKDELGVQLKYTTYKAALEAMLLAETD